MATVNLKMLAEKSGLSLMTVSRVMRGVGGHAPQTVQKVHKVAAKLGYRPNGLARALRSNRTGLVGLLLNRALPNPAPMDMFAGEIVSGAEVELLQHDYMVLLGSVSPKEIASGEMPAMVSEGYVEGAISYGIRDAVYLKKIQTSGTQVVTLDAHLPGVPAIMSANRDGGYTAGKYLWALGHRRLAFVDSTLLDANFQARLAGFQSAVDELAGKRIEITIFKSDQMADCGVEAGRRIATMDEAPTGVFCANDYVAACVMKGITDGGKQVPADVSIVGFDDVEMSRHLTPPLTTLAVPRAQMGQRAVQLLMDLMAGRGEKSNGPHTVPVQFMERGSVRAISQPATGRAGK